MGASPADEKRPIALTVALCTYQRCALLQKALESLIGQLDVEPSGIEVLVADNGSTDNTVAMSQEVGKRLPFETRVVIEPRKGLSYGRNLAVREARGDVVAFLDDDAVAQPGWISGHLEAYRSDPEVAGVMGRVLPVWEKARPDWLDPALDPFLTIVDFGDEPFTLTYPAQSPVGANMSFLRKALLEVGLFDERFGVGGVRKIPYEETELAGRLHARGLKLVYAPRAVVMHGVPASRATVKWMSRRIVDQGRAELVYDLDHGSRRQAIRKALVGAFVRGPLLALAAIGDFCIGRRARAARRASVSCHAAGYLQELAYMLRRPAKRETAL